MDAIIINRVSDRKQKEGYSLNAQQRHGMEYASQKGFQVLKVYTFQETASKQTQRKRFSEILDFVEDYPNHKALALIVEKSDRLGRNHRDKEYIQELYRSGKIEVHLYKEGRIFDKNSNATDIFIDDIMTSVGKYAALNIARESIKGMTEKCEQGWYPSKAPFGYLNVKDPQTKFKVSAPDPESRHLVLKIFELRAQMKSYETIRLEILESGLVPAKFLGRFARQSAMEKILKMSFYSGRFYWRGNWYQGKHELIIPPVLYQKVQNTFNKAGSSKHQKMGLLTNWIDCQCGCKVTYDPKLKSLKSTGEKKFYPYYRCANGKKAHAKLVYMSETKIIDKFGDAVDQITVTGDLAKDIAEALNRTHQKVKAARRREIEGYKVALKNLEGKEDECYQDLKLGILDDAGYQRQLARVRKERERFTDLMAQAQEEIDDAYLVTAKKILELAKNAKSLWLSRTLEERRDFLEKLLSNRVLDAPSVRYELKKPFRVLSEMVQKSQWRPQGDSNPCCRRERAVS